MGSSSLALDFLKLSSQLRDGHGAPTLFYGAVLAGLEEATAQHGRCRVVVRVGQELCHFGKSAHGGALASLIDIVTSAAVLTLKPAALSLHLSTSYIGMAPLGCRLVCEAQVARAGRSTALVNAELKVEGSEALVAQGTHVMFLSDAAPPVEKFMAKFRAAGQGGEVQEGGARSAAEHAAGDQARAKL